MSEIAPLVPADCDLRDFAFMPLDVVRLRDSELALQATGDEFRAAVVLWCVAWHQLPAGSLPDDDKSLAGLAGFGRVVKEWLKVRDGALRGWVKCSDGRLYHPVVAEKAGEAWRAKLKQRWQTECARIKKHLQRHELPVFLPDFDEWLSSGCPVGQPLTVPRDKAKSPGDVPRETPSNRQGEGQGQGQGQGQKSKASGQSPNGADSLPKSRRLHGSPDDHTAARWIFDKLRTVLPDANEPNWDGWANDIRLMREQDGRQHREVCELFGWANGNSFWAANILSPGKLREKWDQLTAQRQRDDAGQGSRTAGGNKQQALEQRNAQVARDWVPPELRGQQASSDDGRTIDAAV